MFPGSFGIRSIVLCKCSGKYIDIYFKLKITYPISTLPEHLHSTIPSYAKIPENTLTEKKNSFSLFNAHYLFDRSPQLPHPLHWETQPHPLIHNHSILSAQGGRSRLLESLPMLRLLRLSLSYRCFLFINFY